MTDLNILVTSAGRRVGLVNCFRDAASRLGVGVRMICADLQPDLSAACAVADHALSVPAIGDTGYVDAIAEICEREAIGLVVPTIDPELLPLAEASSRLAALGAHVNVSSPAAIRIARDKLETASILGQAGIATPRSFVAGDPGATDLSFPLIAKPRGGSSSIGIRIIDNQSELAAFGSDQQYLIQERVAGPEYTVNLFVNAAGELKAAVPHLRIETRAGEVSKGRTERFEAMTETAKRLVAAMAGLRGALCFQCFSSDQGPVVFEINARFGGGYPLAHHAGARFAQWLIEDRLELPSTASDDWRSGVLMLRHDSEIFL